MCVFSYISVLFMSVLYLMCFIHNKQYDISVKKDTLNTLEPRQFAAALENRVFIFQAQGLLTNSGTMRALPGAGDLHESDKRLNSASESGCVTM
jgi:hypothetical protein